MSNRPFTSLQDFINRTAKRVVTKDKIINLIKSGAFNRVEHKTTAEILDEYIKTVADLKNKLTMQNANMLIDYNLIPDSYITNADTYKLTKELRTHRDKNKIWYIVDSLNMPQDKITSWRNIFKTSGVSGEELIIDGEPHKAISSKDWDRFYDSQMLPLKTLIQTKQKELLTKLNYTLFNNEYQKYCHGNPAMWELDSINFFFSYFSTTNIKFFINLRCISIKYYSIKFFCNSFRKFCFAYSSWSTYTYNHNFSFHNYYKYNLTNMQIFYILSSWK